MTSGMRKVAVVGGGWAGCAAAVELARQGRHVTLFESARMLGGRARGVEINGMMLDNGQHIMLGAYRDTLRLMRTVGISDEQAFLRLPLQMRYPDQQGMDFIAPRLPAPFHLLVALLRARGLDRNDKLALTRFSTTARWMDWQLHEDCSVSELLDRFDQTSRLVQLMWRPLCIAALNTPPERASAQVFLNVLRDSLGARRTASDMLLPRLDLTALFPQQAAAFIESAGGAVHAGCTVQALRKLDTGWQLDTGAGQNKFDSVIIATQPTHAASLLETLDDAPALPAFDYEPITTCYLQYDAAIKLPQPFLALIDDEKQKEWGQFVFDRGQLHVQQAGLLAVVVSASALAIEHGQQELSEDVARQLVRVLGMAALARPLWSKVITEKRATFSCTPALVRPSPESGLAGLYLAGDYLTSDYPATLEAATRSGIAAARLAAAIDN